MRGLAEQFSVRMGIMMTHFSNYRKIEVVEAEVTRLKSELELLKGQHKSAEDRISELEKQLAFAREKARQHAVLAQEEADQRYAALVSQQQQSEKKGP